MDEAYQSLYTVHPRRTKTYRNVRESFWWNKMKRDIAKFVKQCCICLQVKAKHYKLARSLQPLQIPKWKLKHLCIDFAIGLPRALCGQDAVLDRLQKMITLYWSKLGILWRSLQSFAYKRLLRLHGVPMSIVLGMILTPNGVRL